MPRARKIEEKTPGSTKFDSNIPRVEIKEKKTYGCLGVLNPFFGSELVFSHFTQVTPDTGVDGL